MKSTLFVACLMFGMSSKLGLKVDDKIRGVNLGGWLVLEPWITPSLFEPYVGQEDAPKDEYMLSERLGTLAKETLEKHRSSWVTLEDFNKLKEAGINYVRIPVGYWAVDIQPDEPWVEGSFQYLEQGVLWAKETGLKVMIDIHGAPGSQNGYDNSGRYGPIQFLEPDNLNRLLKVLQQITKHFTKPEFKSTVTSIELVNEPDSRKIDIKGIKDYYTQGINTVRKIDKEVTIVLHDAFKELKDWEYLKNDKKLSSNDNIMYDIHRYQVFEDYFYNFDNKQHLNYSCSYLESISHANKIYPVVVGEWSLAITDCTKYLTGFQMGTRYEGTLDPDNKNYNKHDPGSCSKYDNLSEFSDEHKQFLNELFQQQVGVYEASGSGWFFWNFKAENSPEWNFLMGVEQGWIDLHEPIYFNC